MFKRVQVRKKGSKIREKTTRSCEGTLKFCFQGCIKFPLFPLPVPRPVNFGSFGRFRLNLWKLHVLQTVQTIKPAQWKKLEVLELLWVWSLDSFSVEQRSMQTET